MGHYVRDSKLKIGLISLKGLISLCSKRTVSRRTQRTKYEIRVQELLLRFAACLAVFIYD